MIKKIIKGLAGLVVTLLVLGLVIYIATSPAPPPAGSSSAEWLENGPYATATAEFVFIDDSRSTNPNREFPGKPERTFPTTLWYPQDSDELHPLIIHSHGIVSSRTELAYMAENLASHGYVVAATDYPLTSGATPGGANAADVMNQPADVSFLIDSVLALSDAEKPFAGSIDTTRLGTTGYSLGGLTSLLVTYHPRWRDSRLAAAVAIAGPAAVFTSAYYTTTDIPFLMIAGTSDALIDHGYNAAIAPARNPRTGLLTIDGGTHLGFTDMSDPLFRFMHNPDSLGCSVVLSVLEEDPNEVFSDLGTLAEGIYLEPNTPGVCALMPLRESSHPGRQKMITQLGVLSFFESVFAESQADRDAALKQLSIAISADFEEASYIAPMAR